MIRGRRLEHGSRARHRDPERGQRLLQGPAGPRSGGGSRRSWGSSRDQFYGAHLLAGWKRDPSWYSRILSPEGGIQRALDDDGHIGPRFIEKNDEYWTAILEDGRYNLDLKRGVAWIYADDDGGRIVLPRENVSGATGLVEIYFDRSSKLSSVDDIRVEQGDEAGVEFTTIQATPEYLELAREMSRASDELVTRVKRTLELIEAGLGARLL